MAVDEPLAESATHDAPCDECLAMRRQYAIIGAAVGVALSGLVIFLVVRGRA